MSEQNQKPQQCRQPAYALGAFGVVLDDENSGCLCESARFEVLCQSTAMETGQSKGLR
uniref:hypothetical protein n=1 Tax=Orrella sp. TaxID=1921583 RepID=UPI00404766AB